MKSLGKIVICLGLLLSLGSFVLAGCHTVRGAGEDIQGAGRAVERATD
jgi:predicted small secreted protein